MFKLRPYQKESVDSVIKHFRATKNPAVLVLPTGAGKSLVIAELARLKNSIDSTIVNKRQFELLELRQQIDDLVDASEFSLQEVLEAKPMRKPVLPKYKNPNDAEQTWTGRGRRPRWVEDCLSGGMSLEDIAI